MGADSLGLDDEEFWEDAEDVVIICVKSDKTVNVKTTIRNIEELKSVFSTGYLMTIFHDTKSYPDGIDKLN